MIDSYNFDRLRRSVAPKYNIRNLKQFQYEKKINIVINSVNYIINLNNILNLNLHPFQSNQKFSKFLKFILILF